MTTKTKTEGKVKGELKRKMEDMTKKEIVQELYEEHLEFFDIEFDVYAMAIKELGEMPKKWLVDKLKKAREESEKDFFINERYK